MSYKINNIEELVKEIVSSPSKAIAQPAITKLEIIHLREKENLPPHINLIFSTLISYAKEASGQVSEKSHWIKCSLDTLNHFKQEVGNYNFTKENISL